MLQVVGYRMSAMPTHTASSSTAGSRLIPRDTSFQDQHHQQQHCYPSYLSTSSSTSSQRPHTAPQKNLSEPEFSSRSTRYTAPHYGNHDTGLYAESSGYSRSSREQSPLELPVTSAALLDTRTQNSDYRGMNSSVAPTAITTTNASSISSNMMTEGCYRDRTHSSPPTVRSQRQHHHYQQQQQQHQHPELYPQQQQQSLHGSWRQADYSTGPSSSPPLPHRQQQQQHQEHKHQLPEFYPQQQQQFLHGSWQQEGGDHYSTGPSSSPPPPHRQQQQHQEHQQQEHQYQHPEHQPYPQQMQQHLDGSWQEQGDHCNTGVSSAPSPHRQQQHRQRPEHQLYLQQQQQQHQSLHSSWPQEGDHYDTGPSSLSPPPSHRQFSSLNSPQLPSRISHLPLVTTTQHSHSQPPSLTSTTSPSRPESMNRRQNTFPNFDHHSSSVQDEAKFVEDGRPLNALRRQSRSSSENVLNVMQKPNFPPLRNKQPIIYPPPDGCYFSHATVENERYLVDGGSAPDHYNEDQQFAIEGRNFKAFGVFDGHDGPRASEFASKYLKEQFGTESWSRVVSNADSRIVPEVLKEFFLVTEKEFFKEMKEYIDEMESLQRRIPRHLSSYAAYQQYPTEVARLQDIEPMLTGGCTAVLAVIVNNHLYVANVGDSRAILVREAEDGSLLEEQLSVDHSVENEEELERLEELGLDREQLLKSGRLGTCENTRSIGDYSIKGGYKNVDSLRSAKAAPGIATPYIMPTKEIDHTWKYLILMTDGVYKSITSVLSEQDQDSNKILTGMIRHQLGKEEPFESLAGKILSRTASIHEHCYQVNAVQDPRSALAVACRKRDDMTLLMYKFQHS